MRQEGKSRLSWVSFFGFANLWKPEPAACPKFDTQTQILSPGSAWNSAWIEMNFSPKTKWWLFSKNQMLTFLQKPNGDFSYPTTDEVIRWSNHDVIRKLGDVARIGEGGRRKPGHTLCFVSPLMQWGWGHLDSSNTVGGGNKEEKEESSGSHGWGGW